MSDPRPLRWAPRRPWPLVAACLDGFLERFPRAARLQADPVSLAHGRPERDAEVAALVAACLAFGNAKALVAKAGMALVPLGSSLGDACIDVAATRGRVPPHLEGWTHRWVRGADLAWLLAGIGGLLHERGSLRAAFMDGVDARAPTLLEPMRAFALGVRGAAARAGWGDASTRGRAHLLPVPDGRAASKRLCLFLRWMARPADGVDLGLWPDVPPSRLTIPVDVHVARIGSYLGLTEARTPGWRMAREITGNLARFDAGDPTKYDFALSHLGIMGSCPRRRNPRACRACDLVSACRL